MLFRLPLLAVVCVFTVTAAKRPLTHADSDSWKHIQDQRLSDDGKWLAYAVFPEEGDGALIVRNLQTGKEWRESVGQLPPPPPPNYADPFAEEGPPRTPKITIDFTADGRTLVFSSFPSRGEVQKAKLEKKKPADRPKNGMGILDLSTGQTFRAASIKSFQVPSEASGLVAYLSEDGALKLRKIGDGAERSFPAVTEYAFAKDGKMLVYATKEGVYAAAPDAEAAALTSDKAQGAKLTWDENQDELAFVGGGKLYLWNRGAATATPVVTDAGPHRTVSDRGAISFSKDGKRVFFGWAPVVTLPKPNEIPVEDRVSVDLWHWKDDYIQPAQKVRAETDRSRSFRAVYHVPEKKFVALADETMEELVPDQSGLFAVGGDDREYRGLIDYDERYADSFLVDTLTGRRKLLATKHLGRVTWSPAGDYAIYFNGRDWITLSVAKAKTFNITEKIGLVFGSEDHDSPGAPTPYGLAGWTEDGKSVLVYDHFDVWKIAPDGSAAFNLTQGAGRKQHLMLRYVKPDAPPAERVKVIDPAKPLLLRAESSDTYDSGFYTTTLNASAAPRKLLFAAKDFSAPVKAKNAEVLALTESTFNESPDLQITDSSFRELRKVSDANPQKANLLWGSAELVHFRNVDGVALKATLYKPENFDAKKRYPMLVYIYERLSQGLNTFIEPRPSHNINISYYVSNGYLVLEPDIAYKIGYPGQSALQCVLPAIQEVVDRGFVDENAIGIQGHSWGGYQIAYMITQTNRFRAVAAGAPVADMISAYDGIRWGPGRPRQFQYEKTQSRIGGSLWQYPLRYIENSPVLQADRVHTPIMMIHNDADDAVPWYQGVEYYLALRRLGKEAYLFVYNGEPHGLRRRPNQKDYTVRLQQYFDYYLKGAPKPEWMVHGIPYLEKGLE